MPEKTIEQTIRNAGNAARIVGGISLILGGAFSLKLIPYLSELSAQQIAILLSDFVLAGLLVFIGQRVYKNPTKERKPEVITLLVLSVGWLASSAIRTQFPLILLFIVFYSACALQAMKKSKSVNSAP